MNQPNEQNMAALMEQLSNSGNPKTQMLAQMLMQQNQKSTNKLPNEKVKGQMRKLIGLNKDLKKRVNILKKQKSQLVHFLDFFIEINGVFSSAVGACECWGDDQSCEKCKGTGTPGTFRIDADAFEYYVRPSILQMEPNSEVEEINTVPTYNET